MEAEAPDAPACFATRSSVLVMFQFLKDSSFINGHRRLLDESDGRLPMSPNAPVRLSWDVASMVLISGDLRIELQPVAQAVAF